MASGPAADPVAGSSVTPRAAGANIRLRQCRPEPAKQYAATPANPASAVICGFRAVTAASSGSATYTCVGPLVYDSTDRKSTRLNSSHANISYAVFCLKKKKKT